MVDRSMMYAVYTSIHHLLSIYMKEYKKKITTTSAFQSSNDSYNVIYSTDVTWRRSFDKIYKIQSNV